jgi:uncharacterized protein YbjQ (UPF0145 family)
MRGAARPLPHDIKMVVDMHAGGTPLTGTAHHQSYATNESKREEYNMTKTFRPRPGTPQGPAQQRAFHRRLHLGFQVNEFLLVRKAGFEPIGLCVGTCVYHVGIQYGSWSKNQELDVLSKAMYHARELAMSRMRAEASAMGADGIVGVKLTIKRLEWDEHLLEFIAIGTGVVHGDGPQGLPRA